MKPALLIVDDEAAIRELLQRHFRYLGYDVATAENGVAALEALADRRTDIVISDIRMPEMDGVTLLERIRADYPMVRVIMITGFVTQESILACMRAGAETCIFKPVVDLEVLEQAVETSVKIIKHWWRILAELRGRRGEGSAESADV